MSRSCQIQARLRLGHQPRSAGLVFLSALALLLASSAIASPAERSAGPILGQATSLTDTTFELFFEAELVAEGEIKPFVVADDPFDRSFSMSRDLIAQGSGTLRGPSLEGTVTWSKLVRKFPEHHYGRTHVSGWLETDQGAEIFFKATGYVQDLDTESAGAPIYSASLSFEADLEPDYEWLNSVLAIWQGSFDPETSTFRYRAYVPVLRTGSTTTKP